MTVIRDDKKGFTDLQKALEDVKGLAVLVGLFGASDSEIVKIGAAHEFGATINHPGGTDYGFKNQRQANRGQVRFLKKGQGLISFGKTRPHTITLPERSWLRSAYDENINKVMRLMEIRAKKLLKGEMTARQLFNQVGVAFEGIVKKKISTGPFAPLKPATIRRKKSSRPLIDTGRMRNSVTYKVVGGK